MSGSVHLQEITQYTERFTGFPSVIQSDHTYIHAGYGFQFPSAFSLGNAAVKGCVIRAPALSTGAFIHWRPTRTWTSEAAIKVEFFEVPTYTGGTELAGVVNMNRNSSRTPNLILVDGTLTITDNGDLLSIDGLGGGGSPARVGAGAGGNENEIVLKPGLEYLLLFTNLTTTTTVVTADIFWYEEVMG